LSPADWRAKLAEFLASPDPDQTLLEHIRQVAIAQSTTALWRPGRPLKLLLAGYFGAGNVGSDMRASEIVRQIRFLLGADHVSFSALSLRAEWPPDILSGVRCRLFEGYVPQVLAEAVDEHEGVIACEGSMFKSTFSNALSATMAAALGLASDTGKVSVAYGSEVGAMDAALEKLVIERASSSLIMCRNDASCDRARSLGLRAILGADTAWTFEAGTRDEAAMVLRGLGWNGSDPILAVCPANPFWWPVRANPMMAFELELTGAHKELQHSSIFFHAHSAEIERKYRSYVHEIARAVDRIGRSLGAFVLVIGMERIDETACRDLAGQLPGSVPTMLGCRHPVRDVVGLLRSCSLLISSRFHAIVGAMPSLVPSIGIANDERIGNLLSGSPRLLRAADPDLGERIVEAARTLDLEEVRRSSRATVEAAIRGMGMMGIAFADEVRRVLPDLPLAVRDPGWQSHLPPLPAAIQDLLG
jgi:polysaccharide pyruvyl transferase WcaK-like protein